MGSIPGLSSLSDETLNRGPMTIFQDKLLTRTYCDEAGDYVMPNMLSPRDLVFRPDIGQKLYHHHNADVNLTVFHGNKSLQHISLTINSDYTFQEFNIIQRKILPSVNSSAFHVLALITVAICSETKSYDNQNLILSLVLRFNLII